MNEKTFINPEGGWQPNKKIEFDPIFVWPPRPKSFFKWLLNFPGYIWPWNLFFIAIAIICYLFIQFMNSFKKFLKKFLFFNLTCL